MFRRTFCAAALTLCAAQLSACAAARPAASAQPAEPSYAVEFAPAGVNPLTGLADEDASDTSRPVAVIIDNVAAALPQRGLAQADIIYETVTEGGITRLMAVYSSPDRVPDTGPVRSARDAFVQLALPLGAMLVHTGGSAPAVQMLARYEWDDKCFNGYVQSDVLTLDTERSASLAIEHCWFTSGAQLAEAVHRYELSARTETRPLAFSFSDAGRTPEEGAAADVYIRFSSYANSRLQYDAETGLYRKWQFGEEHLDANTGEQIAFDNILVLFVPTEKYPDGVLTNVDFEYGGGGFYISRGGYESIRWLKGAPEEPLRITRPDTGEMPAEINPGTTYVAFVPLDLYEYFAVSAQAGDPARAPR